MWCPASHCHISDDNVRLTWLAGETKIGLSYGKLCQFVKPGNSILLSDGTITIEVGWAPPMPA
jgi:pyruvate kinase